MARRNNAEVLARRNEIAQEHGFSSYGQARRYRRLVREELREFNIELGRSPAAIEAIDSIGIVMRDVSEDGTSGLSSTELYDVISDSLLEAGLTELDLQDENGYDVPWSLIRSFYPRTRG